jgi:hypothetical protein
MQAAQVTGDLYGLLGEFERGEDLVQAAERAYGCGYRKLNGYTPFPVHGLSEALGQQPTRLPLAVLIGGVLGGCAGYFMMYYASVISYPINVGGRPMHSWPAFIPITFEMTVLGAAGTAFFGMLAKNGLPQPNHPLFNVPAFTLASRDRFFLSIQSSDLHFDVIETRKFLEGLGARVHEVPP